MSPEEIEIQFEQMNALSDSLSAAAGELYGAVNGTGMKILSDIKASWTGDNADAFARKEVRVTERIRESAGALEALAGEIKRKSEQIYRLEVWNTLTARARSYR